MTSSALQRFARLSRAAAFFLLIAGGLVTSTGSSLAVPDWPLSYGQYFPRMTGGVLFEHGHRMLAGAVALLTWTLAAWIWAKEERRWVRRLAAAAALGILLQAVLGGITVLYGLPHAVSIAHAVLGQTIFCLLVALAEVTGWPKENFSSGSRWHIGAATVCMLYVQLFLGALVRHTHIPVSVLMHVIGALLASGLLARLAYVGLVLYPAQEGLQKPSIYLSILLPLQLLLGLAAYVANTKRYMAWPAAVPTAHVVCGALLLATSMLWTLRAWRGGNS